MTTLAETILRDVPRYSLNMLAIEMFETPHGGWIKLPAVEAALSRALDPSHGNEISALTERAGEVLEGVTPGPWRTHAVDDTAIISSDGTDVGTTCDSAKAERDDAYNNNYEQMEADARFIAWCREGVPALLAQNSALRAERDEPHWDDHCVNQFAKMMREKMALSRAKGRSGWNDPNQCSVEYLRNLLYEHLDKGDPVDVANFCMMLRHYDASTRRDYGNTLDMWKARAEAAEAEVEKLRGALMVARAHVANNAEGWSVSRGAARDDLTIVDAALTTEADNE